MPVQACELGRLSQIWKSLRAALYNDTISLHIAACKVPPWLLGGFAS